MVMTSFTLFVVAFDTKRHCLIAVRCLLCDMSTTRSRALSRYGDALEYIGIQRFSSMEFGHLT